LTNWKQVIYETLKLKEPQSRLEVRRRIDNQLREVLMNQLNKNWDYVRVCHWSTRSWCYIKNYDAMEERNLHLSAIKLYIMICDVACITWKECIKITI